jgi:hypothetical protein
VSARALAPIARLDPAQRRPESISARRPKLFQHAPDRNRKAMTKDASILFTPFDLRGLKLSNRIVMAPMTRSRATHGTGAPSR